VGKRNFCLNIGASKIHKNFIAPFIAILPFPIFWRKRTGLVKKIIPQYERDCLSVDTRANQHFRVRKRSIQIQSNARYIMANEIAL
jgi:hypothetical protein